MPIIVPVPPEPPTDTEGGAYDLAALVTARLETVDDFTTYRAVVPKTMPGAYVVLYFGGGRAGSRRLDATPRELRWTFRAVCCGLTDSQALDTVDVVRFLLTGWRPLPTRRGTGRLNEIDTDPPLLRDDSVPGDIRFSQTLSYRLYTTRSH